MKTLKSIQKNQAQLNSLLMEKWGYGKEEKLEEQDDDREQTSVDMPARDAARAKLIADLPVDTPTADTSDTDMPARDAARAKLVDELPDTEEETLEEERDYAKPGDYSGFVSEEGKKPFPDLTGDGKVTQADILKGRDVIDEEEDDSSAMKEAEYDIELG